MSRFDPQVPKNCLPPVVAPSTRLLILGSLPGEASLTAERYYAHPRNQFWRLMEEVLGEPVASLPYDERLALLGRRGVGLWDTVGSARRQGSLDGAMRDVMPNALCDLAAGLPDLRAIAFNGGTAAKIGRRQLGGFEVTLVDLPSSSPALTIPFTAKAERWVTLQRFVSSAD